MFFLHRPPGTANGSEVLEKQHGQGEASLIEERTVVKGNFKTYLKDRERGIKTSLSAIEKRGALAALDRCRLLADQIESDLRGKKVEHFVNISALADFQASLEHAASVLERNSDVHGQSVSAANVYPVRRQRENARRS